MPRWLPRVVSRIRELAADRRVAITDKARRELELLELGLDREDLCEVVAGLSSADFYERIASSVMGEWLYVFKPDVAGTTLYVKLAVRGNCVVISFHEDQDE